MNDKKRLLMALLITLALLLGTAAAPVQARADVFKDKYSFAVEWYDFVPCAAGGAGEWIYVTGTFYVKAQTIFDSGGGFHGTYHVNSKGLQAVGLTTGDVYKAKQVENRSFNGKNGYNETYQYKLMFVGPGPGNNVLAQYRFHITINARGEVTAYTDNWRYVCK